MTTFSTMLNNNNTTSNNNTKNNVGGANHSNMRQFSTREGNSNRKLFASASSNHSSTTTTTPSATASKFNSNATTLEKKFNKLENIVMSKWNSCRFHPYANHQRSTSNNNNNNAATTTKPLSLLSSNGSRPSKTANLANSNKMTTNGSLKSLIKKENVDRDDEYCAQQHLYAQHTCCQPNQRNELLLISHHHNNHQHHSNGNEFGAFGAKNRNNNSTFDLNKLKSSINDMNNKTATTTAADDNEIYKIGGK